MSGEALDLRRSAQIIRRQKALVGAAAALGLLAGVGYTILNPPVYTSSALVSISPAVGASSQTAVVTSAPVVSLAVSGMGPGVSSEALQNRIHAVSAGYALMSISGSGNTPAQAVAAANAVARSYVAYVGSAADPAGQVPAQVLQPAEPATGPALSRWFYAAAGVLAGALIGGVIALAVGRNDRRLRTRDDIADSIGVPVLASIRAHHPSKAADWAKLLEGYEPQGADAWRLRTMLHQLGAVGPDPADLRTRGGSSLAVLSLSGDRSALALGPQVAAFAASLGVSTTLVAGPRQDANFAGALYDACAAARESARGPGNLHVTASDDGGSSQLPGSALTVIVAVVDGHAPRVANAMSATTTVLGVTQGAVTAQQLARVAAGAAGADRDIVGILVADPDPADQTTGRLPQVARPAQHRMPTRMTGAATEVIK